ncbi:MAG: ribosome recycling factor [Candidatus Absconditabacterales bacterium]
MDISGYRQQMDKSISYLLNELKSLQVGRASVGLIENINVEASYGMMKIPQMAHVTLMDAQTLKIEPWDKNETKHIEKAIYDSNSGLTPKNEGAYVIVKIPALTQERRLEISKQVKAMGEDIKARVRLIRQDAIKDSKKLFDDKQIGEDENKRNEKDIDALTKSMNEKVDELIKNKTDEIMKV